ncbi:MAG: hypothetical protein GY756_10290 [bacterium]|nr:hypothetical protein [bacterium]
MDRQSFLGVTSHFDILFSPMRSIENGGDVNFQVEIDGETKPAIFDLIEKGNEELA